MLRLLLGLLSIALVHGITIQEIQTKVSATGLINDTTVGVTLGRFFSQALPVKSIRLTGATYKITGNQLTVTATSTFASVANVPSVYNFYQAGQVVQVYFTMSFASTTIQGLYEFVGHTTQLPESLRDLSATASAWVLSGASAPAVGPNGGLPAAGVAIGGSSTVVGGTLLSALHWLRPGVSSLEATASLFVPVSNVTDIVLSVSSTTPFQLTKDLTASGFSVVVQRPIALTFHVPVIAAVGKGTSAQSLNFLLTGAYTASDNELLLTGALTSEWTHPWGMKWLNLQSATGTLRIESSSTQVFSIAAKAILKWSASPVDVLISFSGNNFEDVLFEISNIPESNKVARIFSDVTGAPAPSNFDQVQVTASGTIAIATYSTGNFQEGFNYIVTAQVTEGSDLLKAVQVLSPAATSSTYNFDFTLYVPIFTQAQIEVSLVESGSPFTVHHYLTCSGFSIDFDLATGSTDLKISAAMSNKLKDGNVLSFSVLADFEVSSETVEFKGTLTSPWTNPFGWKWMNLGAGSNVDLKFGMGIDPFELTFTGQCQLAWLFGMTTDVTIGIGGPEMGDAVFSISQFPINKLTLGIICQYVIGSVPDIVTGLNPNGNAGLSIATYAAPSAPLGFTIQGTVTVDDDGNGDVFKALSLLSSNPTMLTYSFYFNVALFGSNPGELELKFTENGQYPWTKSVDIENYSLDVKVGQDTSFTISCGVAVSVKTQATPLDFDVSATFQITDPSVTLSGSLNSPWVHPFHQQWMNLTNVALTLVVGSDPSVSLSGTAMFQVKGDSGTADASISISEDDASLSFDIDNHWTIYELSAAVLGKGPADLVQDIETKVALTIGFSLSTASGVTFSAMGNVTGQLQKDIKHVSYWWDHAGNSFAISVSLPIFSSDPAGVTLSLAVVDPYIQLSKHLWFDSTTFSIAVAPFSISLDTKLKAQFNKNPVLYFEVNGAFKEDGSFLTWGAMEGTWDDPFGIKGFALSNVILEIGFNPTTCGVTACLSDLGFGVGLQFANDIITFDGNAAAPDFWDIYLAGEFQHNPKKTLTVVDVVSEWNKINPASPVPSNGIPPTWGLEEVAFYFAPVSGMFGPITYAAGFGITGDIIILDINIFISLNCTDAFGFSCNFAFDVSIPPHQFEEKLKHEVSLMYPSNPDVGAIFKLDYVSLTSWTQHKVSTGLNPHFQLGLDVLGVKKGVNVHVDQGELGGSFHDFFIKWIKHLF